MKKLQILITSLFLLGLTASPVTLGDLYKWVDNNGNIHYGDNPPDNAELRKIQGNVSSFTSVSVEPFTYDESLLTARTKSRKVVMYSTSWCGYCKKAAQHFKKNRIPFIEYDIEKSAKAARDYRKLRGRGVPIILIGDRRMNGFDARAFDRVYYNKS